MAIGKGVFEVQDSEEESVTSSPTNVSSEAMRELITQTPDLRFMPGTTHPANDTSPAHSDQLDSSSSFSQCNVSSDAKMPRIDKTEIISNATIEQTDVVAEQTKLQSFKDNMKRTNECIDSNPQPQIQKSLKSTVPSTASYHLLQQSPSDTLVESSESITEHTDHEADLHGSPQDFLVEAIEDSIIPRREFRHEQVRSGDCIRGKSQQIEFENAPRVAITSLQEPPSDIAPYAADASTITSNVSNPPVANQPTLTNQVFPSVAQHIEKDMSMQNPIMPSAKGSSRKRPLASPRSEPIASSNFSAIKVPHLEIYENKDTIPGAIAPGVVPQMEGTTSPFHLQSRIDAPAGIEIATEIRQSEKDTREMDPNPRNEAPTELRRVRNHSDAEVAGSDRKDEDSHPSCHTKLPMQQAHSAKDSNTKIASPNLGEKSQSSRSKQKAFTLACPSSSKSSQEATLAELRAQKSALLASLAALPAVQVLIEEAAAAAAQPDTVDDDDGPNEADIIAAANKIVKDHIKLLHEYNELKDIGQGLMGLIADQRGVRIVEVHEEFGIDAKD